MDDAVNNNSVPSSGRNINEHPDQNLLERARKLSWEAFGGSTGAGHGHGSQLEQPRQDRRFSVGILKRNDGGNKEKMRRKSVSFSRQNNIHILEEVFLREDDEDEQEQEEEVDLGVEEEEVNKTLFPTFVFPGKKDDFGLKLRQKIVILDSLHMEQNALRILGDSISLRRIKCNYLKNFSIHFEKFLDGSYAWVLDIFIPTRHLDHCPCFWP